MQIDADGNVCFSKDEVQQAQALFTKGYKKALDAGGSNDACSLLGLVCIMDYTAKLTLNWVKQ